MRLTSSIAAIVCISTTCMAQSADPAVRFIETVAQIQEHKFQQSDSLGSPSGSYIYRFELPADKNEGTILFLGSSLDCEKDNCYWAMFYRSPKGAYDKLKDEFFLPASAISQSEIESTFVYSVLLIAGREGNDLESFSITNEGKLDVKSRPLTIQEINALSDGARERPTDETLQKAFDTISKLRKSVVARNIEKINLKDFQRDNSIRWRPINQSFTLSEQYRDPADREIIATPSPTATTEPP